MTVSAPPRVVPQSAELNIIGDFEFLSAGEFIAIPPASQRLVSYLAFQHRPVRRAHISGTLWPDADEHHASASLRTALWRLQPLDIVRVSNTHLCLNPCVEVDLRRMIGRATDVLRGTPPKEALVVAACDLLDGGDDLLAGWFEDWVIVERERFRQLRLHALERIGERLLDAGLWHDALQVGLAATGAEPLRESAHRLLVRLHLVEGNISEAIREYRSYAELLGRELGVAPSPIFAGLIAPILPGHQAQA